MQLTFFRRLSLTLVSILVLGCATKPREREFDASQCNAQGGFEAGYNDGREGYAMSSAFATRCREDLRDGVRKGYSEGFAKGGKERAEEMEKQRQAWIEQQRLENERAALAQKPNQPALIVVNPGFGPTTRYQCTVEAFGKRFTGAGSSEAEAKTRAMDSCASSYHSMHCDRAECVKL